MSTHSCIAKKLDTNKSRFKIANEWLPKLGTTGHQPKHTDHFKRWRYKLDITRTSLTTTQSMQL